MTYSTAGKVQETGEAMHWRRALVEKARSVRFRGLSPDMLTSEGEVIKTKEEDRIHFDADFVYHTISERILKPLGLVTPDGKVKSRFITEKLVPAAIKYAETENLREAEMRRQEMAVLMSKYNGRSVEENLDLLKNKEETTKE